MVSINVNYKDAQTNMEGTLKPNTDSRAEKLRLLVWITSRSTMACS
jgi:hypothetical protein